MDKIRVGTSGYSYFWNEGVPTPFQWYCKQRLAPYKVPEIIEFREELPTTLIGKVFKRVLREEEEEKLKKEKA